MSKISISSRHGVVAEYAELNAFVDAVEEADLSMFVEKAEYDSVSQCCDITTLMDVQADEPVGQQLLEIARATITQFELFQVIHHGHRAQNH